MMTDILRMTAITVFIILCTVLPFLPGPYDSMAVPLSMMAQLFGIVGLVLVPIGILWLAAEYSDWRKRRFIFAITALVASSLVWCLVSVAGMLESLSLGLLSLVLWAYVLFRLVPRLRPTRTSPPERVSAVPLYLVIVPAAVAAAQYLLAVPVSEFSRHRGIRNAAPLIADIEQYRTANGRYPLGLLSVNTDYKPFVIGIREYRYEPSGAAYNLMFEQASFHIGVREFVVYNPRDEQVITSHAMDVLQLTPEQLALDRTRGHNAVHNTAHPHWKYFWFD